MITVNFLIVGDSGVVREEYFLRLPGERAVFTRDTFHQRDQFALCADAAHFVSKRRIFCRFHAVTVTHAFHFIGAEFDGGPIA